VAGGTRYAGPLVAVRGDSCIREHPVGRGKEIVQGCSFISAGRQDGRWCVAGNAILSL